MKKFVITEEDKKNILKMYKNNLSEGDIFSKFIGAASRFAKNTLAQSEDDLIRAFKTTEAALAKNIDELVETAIRSGKAEDLVNLERKLLFAIDQLEQDLPKSKEKIKKLLNSYAKSRGNTSWHEIKSKVQPSQTVGASQSSASQAAKNAGPNLFSGYRISNRSFGPDTKWSNMIDWNNITLAKNWDDYNKIIAKAIKSGNYQEISRKGFEKFGIPNFREFLQNNIKTINEVVPETGRWSVTFK